MHYPNVLLTSATSVKAQKQLTELHFETLKKTLREEKSLLSLDEWTGLVDSDRHRNFWENIEVIIKPGLQRSTSRPLMLKRFIITSIQSNV